MSKKKTFINLSIVFGLTAFVLIWLLHDDFEATLDVLKTSNIVYLSLALASFIMTLFTSSLVLTNWFRLFIPEFAYWKVFKSNFLAVFARNVTPMQTGGQAMNAYVLSGEGVPVETSVFVLSIDFVVFQTAQVLFSLFWIIVFLPNYRDNSVMYWGVIIGFIINSSILGTLYLLVLSNRLHHLLGKYGVRVLSKIKIIKDPDGVMSKMDKKIDNFAVQLRYLRKHKQLVAKNVSIVLLGLVFSHSIPFFVARTLNVQLGFETFIEFIALSNFVSTYNALLPMPGGTGGLESVFMMIFGQFVDGSSLRVGFMIIWRFVTYYFMVLAGAIAFLVYSGRRNIDNN